MIFEPFAPFLAAEYQVKFAITPWELAGAAALRQAVFCREQGIFEGHDRDAIDEAAIPIVAMWSTSTSSSSGPRRVSAFTSSTGSAQPLCMYTRCPLRTSASATSAGMIRDR